jgi:hypothetical protein
MTITAEELARDKALCERALGGGWRIHAERSRDHRVAIAQFITNSREGWPKYIAEVERLWEENQALKRRDKDRIRAWETKVAEKDAEIARLKASLAQDQVKFQRETLRTDELTQMLHKFMTVYLHEGHTRGPWSRGCQRCELMTETEALLAKPLNVDAAVSGLSVQTPDKE